MPERELASHITTGDLETALKEVNQGDILDVGKVVFLWSPDVPSHPSEVDGVEHEEPAMTEEMRLESGLCVVISQDCDIRRLPDIEPYLLIAPLSEVDDKTYREAADGMSVRFFSYPQVEDNEQRLAVDTRIVQSLEKTALLSPHIKRYACPLSETRRVDLRGWLGRRFGRDVYPDEIVRRVVAPIEQAIKRAREKDAEGVFPAVIWSGLRWTSGKPYASLLLLTDPVRREQNGVGPDQLKMMLNRLQKALHHFSGKAGGDYTIIAQAHDATQVRASDLLEYYELSLDLDATTL